MKAKARPAAALALAVAAAAAWAQAPVAASRQPPRGDVVKLARLLEVKDGYSASFDQRAYDEEGRVLDYRQGKIWGRRPLLFRMDTETPYREQVTSDGSYLWFYEPDLAQAQRSDLAVALADVPVALLAADAAGIEENWRVEETAAEGSRSPVRRVFELRARQPQSYLQRLRLEIYRGKPSKITGWDQTSTRTELVLYNWRQGRQFSRTFFAFDPPEGTDIVDAQDLLGEGGEAPEALR